MSSVCLALVFIAFFLGFAVYAIRHGSFIRYDPSDPKMHDPDDPFPPPDDPPK